MSPQCASINVLGGVKKRFIPCFSVVASGDKKHIPGYVEGPTQSFTLSLLLSVKSTSNVILLFST